MFGLLQPVDEILRLFQFGFEIVGLLCDSVDQFLQVAYLGKNGGGGVGRSDLIFEIRYLAVEGGDGFLQVLCDLAVLFFDGCFLLLDAVDLPVAFLSPSLQGFDLLGKLVVLVVLLSDLVVELPYFLL